MDSEPRYIPHVKIQPNYIVAYSLYNGPRYKKDKLPGEKLMPESNDHKGKVSHRSQMKMKNKINWLLAMTNNKRVYSAKCRTGFTFKLCFITLTLASKQVHSDQVVKSELLNHFLTEARKRWSVKNYIWRAEPQANGNIHFHIITDKFIPWHELRNVWNRIQNKLGYCDRYRDEMRRFHSGGFKVREKLLSQWSYKQQIKAYKKGVASDWNSPNSSDIHSLTKVKNVGAYLCKYVTKNEASRKIEGRLWGLSLDLSKIDGACDLIDSELSDELGKLATIFNDKYYCKDYVDIWYIDVSRLDECEFPRLFALFYHYLRSLQEPAQEQIIYS
jgi:hypothetical protein